MTKLNPRLKLPGLIDVHVHLREPGATQKEDFGTGTMAAVAGGYTQILDMPNNTPPTISPMALNQKIDLAKNRIWCDLGFNFGATASSAKYFGQISNKAFGLKVYMNQTTGPLLVERDQERDLIFKSWSSSLPIMVHAEGETIEAAIKFSKKYHRALHVCHVTADQISAIEKAKKEDVSISCEVCPHHLFLNQSDLQKLGPFGLMKPPLLSKKDQDILWSKMDTIDMISTDHAPHTKEEKRDQSSLKFGVPGLETTLPLMLRAVEEGRISFERLIDMTSENPRKIFRLPSQEKTYLEVDTTKRFKISNTGLFTKCGWTPFGGMKAGGKVVKVILRGETIFENGKFIGKPQGKVIFPWKK